MTSIRGDAGEVLLSYRSFASITGVIAALVTGIVVVAGIAAVLFLVAEGSLLRAAAALALTILFVIFIALLVPRMNVTLFDDDQPALVIAQRRTFGGGAWVVSTPNGTTLGEIRKSAFSRFGRHRWTIWLEGRFLAEAVEQSFSGALLRKLFGKFSRSFETDLVVSHGGIDVGRIDRRTDDTLELTNDALDRRVAVALATLVFGREP